MMRDSFLDEECRQIVLNHIGTIIDDINAHSLCPLDERMEVNIMKRIILLVEIGSNCGRSLAINETITKLKTDIFSIIRGQL